MNAAEQAVERYYATVSQQRITDAPATLTTGDPADNAPGRIRNSVQVYRGCTDDQRQLLNHALFRRLYLADNHITSHEPWPAIPLI